MTLEEAFDLSAQLPLIIRGVFFEAYNPGHVPEKIRSREAFLDAVAIKLQPHRIPPEIAVRAVFATLAHHCDSGEVADVIDQLPGDLKKLWPNASLN